MKVMLKRTLLLSLLVLVVASLMTFGIAAAEKGEPVTVTTAAELAMALTNAAEDGSTVIKLANNIDLDDSAFSPSEGTDEASAFNITKGVTITADTDVTISTNKYQKVFRVYANLILENITITNSTNQGRCVDTRADGIEVTLKNVTLKTTSTANNQPLNIGGTDTADVMTTVTLDNTSIEAGVAGYGIIAWVPCNVNITNGSSVTAYGAVYMKGEADGGNTTGSVITVNASTLSGVNNHSGASDSFGTVVFLDEGITLSVVDSTVEATGTGNQTAIHLGDNRATVSVDSASTVTAQGDNVTLAGVTADTTLALPAGSDLEKDAAAELKAEGVTTLMVAQVNGISYTSFADALAAAGANDTIYLLAAFTVDDTITITKSITIDGGDFTVSSAAANPVFQVSGATVTFQNMTIKAETGTALTVTGASSTITLNSAELDGYKYGIYVSGATQFTLTVAKDTTVKGSSLAGIYFGGTTTGTATIHGEVYSADTHAIQAYKEGAGLNIDLIIETTAYLKGAAAATELNKGVVHVNGSAIVRVTVKGGAQIVVNEGVTGVYHLYATAGANKVGTTFTFENHTTYKARYEGVWNDGANGSTLAYRFGNDPSDFISYFKDTNKNESAKKWTNTIYLFDDVSCSKTISTNYNLIIDGQGHTVTFNNSDKIGISLASAQTLNLQNVTLSGAGHTAIAVTGAEAVTINLTDVSSKDIGTVVAHSGTGVMTLNIKGGSFSATDDVILLSSTASTATNIININTDRNGHTSFSGAGSAIHLGKESTVSATVTVYHADIASTGDYTILHEGTGAMVFTMVSGLIDSDASHAIASSGSGKLTVNLNVVDIEAKTNGIYIGSSCTADITVMGGKFDTDGAGICVDNKATSLVLKMTSVIMDSSDGFSVDVGAGAGGTAYRYTTVTMTDCTITGKSGVRVNGKTDSTSTATLLMKGCKVTVDNEALFMDQQLVATITDCALSATGNAYYAVGSADNSGFSNRTVYVKNTVNVTFNGSTKITFKMLGVKEFEAAAPNDQKNTFGSCMFWGGSSNTTVTFTDDVILESDYMGLYFNNPAGNDSITFSGKAQLTASGRHGIYLNGNQDELKTSKIVLKDNAKITTTVATSSIWNKKLEDSAVFALYLMDNTVNLEIHDKAAIDAAGSAIYYNSNVTNVKFTLDMDGGSIEAGNTGILTGSSAASLTVINMTGGTIQTSDYAIKLYSAAEITIDMPELTDTPVIQGSRVFSLHEAQDYTIVLNNAYLKATDNVIHKTHHGITLNSDKTYNYRYTEFVVKATNSKLSGGNGALYIANAATNDKGDSTTYAYDAALVWADITLTNCTVEAKYGISIWGATKQTVDKTDETYGIASKIVIDGGYYKTSDLVLSLAGDVEVTVQNIDDVKSGNELFESTDNRIINIYDGVTYGKAKILPSNITITVSNSTIQTKTSEGIYSEATGDFKVTLNQATLNSYKYAIAAAGACSSYTVEVLNGSEITVAESGAHTAIYAAGSNKTKITIQNSDVTGDTYGMLINGTDVNTSTFELDMTDNSHLVARTNIGIKFYKGVYDIDIVNSYIEAVANHAINLNPDAASNGYSSLTITMDEKDAWTGDNAKPTITAGQYGIYFQGDNPVKLELENIYIKTSGVAIYRSSSGSANYLSGSIKNSKIYSETSLAMYLTFNGSTAKVAMKELSFTDCEIEGKGGIIISGKTGTDSKLTIKGGSITANGGASWSSNNHGALTASNDIDVEIIGTAIVLKDQEDSNYRAIMLYGDTLDHDGPSVTLRSCTLESSSVGFYFANVTNGTVHLYGCTDITATNNLFGGNTTGNVTILVDSSTLTTETDSMYYSGNKTGKLTLTIRNHSQVNTVNYIVLATKQGGYEINISDSTVECTNNSAISLGGAYDASIVLNNATVKTTADRVAKSYKDDGSVKEWTVFYGIYHNGAGHLYLEMSGNSLIESSGEGGIGIYKQNLSGTGEMYIYGGRIVASTHGVQWGSDNSTINILLDKRPEVPTIQSGDRAFSLHNACNVDFEFENAYLYGKNSVVYKTHPGLIKEGDEYVLTSQLHKVTIVATDCKLETDTSGIIFNMANQATANKTTNPAYSAPVIWFDITLNDCEGTGKQLLNSWSRLDENGDPARVTINGGRYETADGVLNFYGSAEVYINDGAVLTSTGTSVLWVGTATDVNNEFIAINVSFYINDSTINCPTDNKAGIYLANSKATYSIELVDSTIDAYCNGIMNFGTLYLYIGGDSLITTSSATDTDTSNSMYPAGIMSWTGGPLCLDMDGGRIDTAGPCIALHPQVSGTYFHIIMDEPYGSTPTLRSATSYAFWLRDYGSIDLVLENVYISSAGNAIHRSNSGKVQQYMTGSMTNCKVVTNGSALYLTNNATTNTSAPPTLNIQFDVINCDFTSAGYTIQASTSNGDSVINIIGGSYKSLNSDAVVYGLGYVTINIYAGYFESDLMCVARVTDYATMNIYGGYFVNARVSGFNDYTSVIRLGTDAEGFNCSMNVYGGTFVANEGANAIFNLNKGYAFNVFSYNCEGAQAIMTVDNGATVAIPYSSKVHKASTHAPVMINGAQIRLTLSEDNGSGIRFVTNIPANVFEYIELVCDYDSELTMGTVIVPADYLADIPAFTIDALETAGKQYLNIEAQNGIIINEDGSITLRAVIDNIMEQNYDREFAAVAYVMYTVNGQNVYIYSDYDPDNNARSLSGLADKALSDLKYTKTSTHRFPVEIDGQIFYSRYTENQRAALSVIHNCEYTETIVEEATPLVPGYKVVSCEVCGTYYESVIPATGEIKVLFIGNSYSAEGLLEMRNELLGMGIEDVTVGYVNLADATLIDYAEDLSSDEIVYTYYKNSSGLTVGDTKAPLVKGILDESWDIIIVQHSDDDTAGLDNLLEKLELLCPDAVVSSQVIEAVPAE